MNLSYLTTPLLAWLVAGSLKFAVNCGSQRRLAFDLIGYGGFPSNHSAIVSSMATLVALREGLEDPAFGVALTLAFVVMLDAGGLRRQVGRQAAAINELRAQVAPAMPLRERMGHRPGEMLAGVLVGACVAACVQSSGW